MPRMSMFQAILAGLKADEKKNVLPAYADPVELAMIEAGMQYGHYKYLEDFMRDKNDHSTMKAAQLGFTTGVIFVVLFSLVAGIRVLYLLPDSIATTEFSAGKLNPIIWKSKHLSGVCDVDNVRQKLINGVPLYLRGANSRKQLKEVSVGLLILDERDEMKDAMAELAYERLSGHKQKQKIEMSTPGLPGKGIHAIFKASDQYFFVVPCFRCGHVQFLTLENNVNVDGGFYFCSRCTKQWDYAQRMKMNSAGFYRLEQKGNGNTCRHVNQLYSPTITAQEFCTKVIEADGNEAKTQELHNSKLAKPYEAKGARLERELIESRLGTFAGTGQKIAGIDVSQSGPHYCIIGLKTEYGIVVKKILRVSWGDLANCMRDNEVECVVIDCQPERKKALEFLEELSITGYRCLYPEQHAQIVLDDENRIVKARRTDMIDVVFSRFRQNTILIEGNNEFGELRDHILNTVRSYREIRGTWEAYYTEEGPDHYLHALVYLEVASRICPVTAREEIAGRFV